MHGSNDLSSPSLRRVLSLDNSGQELSKHVIVVPVRRYISVPVQRQQVVEVDLGDDVPLINQKIKIRRHGYDSYAFVRIQRQQVSIVCYEQVDSRIECRA